MTRSVCTECGETGPPGEQFCISCGHYLWSSGPPAQVNPAEEPAPVRSADGPAQVKPAQVRPAEKLSLIHI